MPRVMIKGGVWRNTEVCSSLFMHLLQFWNWELNFEIRIDNFNRNTEGIYCLNEVASHQTAE
jgi:hypothetical protein